MSKILLQLSLLAAQRIKFSRQINAADAKSFYGKLAN